jgi:hypothetical protein
LRILFVGHPGVFCEHCVESIGRSQSEEHAILDAVPFHERHSEYVVSDEKGPQSVWEVFVQEDFHC